jgi:hypothetical protein
MLFPAAELELLELELALAVEPPALELLAVGVLLLELEQAVRLAPSTASADMPTTRAVWVRDIAVSPWGVGGIQPRLRNRMRS